jgi:hypothetical protein
MKTMDQGKSLPRTLAAVLVVVASASFLQCPGHSNDHCDCVFYFVLTIDNTSTTDARTYYDTVSRDSYASPRRTTRIVLSKTAIVDTIMYVKKSYCDRGCSLFGNSYDPQLSIVFLNVVHGSDSTKIGAVPWDTTADCCTELSCDATPYFVDTIAVQ